MKQDFIIQKTKPIIGSKERRIIIYFSIAFIVLSTILSLVEVISDPLFYLNIGLGGIALCMSLLMEFTPNDPRCIKLNEDLLEYQGYKKDEYFNIELDLIEQINTHFFEIEILTKDHKMHKLDITWIRDEKARWKLKEFLRGVVNRHTH